MLQLSVVAVQEIIRIHEPERLAVEDRNYQRHLARAIRRELRKGIWARLRNRSGQLQPSAQGTATVANPAGAGD